MHFRSTLEHAGVALGAATEGVWVGALAAVLTGAPWAGLAIFSSITVAAAAYVAHPAGNDERDERKARILAGALVVIATGVLLVAGRGWMHQHLVWQIVRDVVFVSGLALLGIILGHGRQAPDDAVARAVRGFALLCVVLVGAALNGSTPRWAPPAVVAALLAGGLLIAVVRYRSLTDQVANADRLPLLPWLLGVAGTVLGVVAIGMLFIQLFAVDVVRDALEGGLLHALEGVAYVVAVILRALDWLFGLLRLRAPSPEALPRWTPPPLLGEPSHTTRTSGTLRLIVSAGLAAAAIGLAVAFVMMALRRFRREPVGEEVAEEREALSTVRSAAGRHVAGMGRRLRRRLKTLIRREPRAPGEIVRRRYAELERRLARSGRPRLPGVTVRDHLAAAATALAEPLSTGDHEGETVTEASLIRAAAELAVIYELARYSAHQIDFAQADRFGTLARSFVA